MKNSNGLERTERHAVERHRVQLCAQKGCEVSMEEATRDWMSHCRDDWRAKRQAIMLKLQREEMLRHKWIESEKASCDVGKQIYVEWIHEHAAGWRAWYNRHEEDILRAHQLI